MLTAQLALTLFLLVVCSFTPGFLFVRRLRWNPLEKLCGSVGLSLIALYLVCFGAYLFAPVWLTAICRVFAALSVLMSLWAWKDIRRLVLSFGARQTLRGYSFLLIWTLVFLAIIRNSSGAYWTGDWAEHFQRTLFFLHRFPTQTTILGGYALSARPPMMNIVAAFFLAQTADRYELFQLVFAFLNLLLFLPCCLIMRALVKKAGRVLPLVALFAMSPVLMENVTYAWTKGLTALFVVLALGLYLAGVRKNDTVRLVAAFLALAAGLLVHYSAGPYIAFLGLHYLIRVFPARPRRFRELATIGCACGLLLATWFGWSVAVYGIHGTFASNTSVTSSQGYRGSNAQKIASNLFDTLVPAPIRKPEAMRDLDEPNMAGTLRDHVFSFYQTNLIFGMGLVGGPLVLWLFFRAMRKLPESGVHGKPAGEERRFWMFLAPFVVVTGIAVVGEKDPLGVSHLTLLAIEALGITLIAASFPWRRWLAILVIAGCAVDFSLGVYLQAIVESFDNTPQETVFEGFTVTNGQMEVGSSGPDSLSDSAWHNWYLKNAEALNKDWLRRDRELPQDNDAVRHFADLFERSLTTNAREWQGWFARNGGAITFLGDHVAKPAFDGWNAPSLLLLLLFAGLLATLWNQSMRLAPADAPKPRPLRKRPARRR